ncbi:RNA-directed DNA polymerase [Myxococcota bacterium]|nr:RNA-directed DNA polymerase [Myxococcota bacterium]
MVRTLRCFDQVVAPSNLWAAWREFERGKRRRPDVAAFGLDAERHVLALAGALNAGTWRPAGYRLLRVRDPKRRLVSAAPVRDRVVHRALYRVVAPWWDRSFIAHSYACIEGRGAHRALLTFRRRCRRYGYVLGLDMARYFYRIDRERLRGLLSRRLPEPGIRRLVDRILESGSGLYRRPEVVSWLGWSGPGEPGRGLPIGNLTSQWWANVYLDGLDHHVCRELRVAYQRYMDDVHLFGDDPGELLRWRDEVAEWLQRERGLELKDPEARPISTRGAVSYLGYRVTPHRMWLGPKARGRLPAHLRRRLRDPARAGQVVRSFAAAWVFGG